MKKDNRSGGMNVKECAESEHVFEELEDGSLICFECDYVETKKKKTNYSCEKMVDFWFLAPILVVNPINGETKNKQVKTWATKSKSTTR